MRRNNYELLLWPVDNPEQAVRIEHASVSYKLNDIPQAMVRLVHGYSFKTGAAVKLPESWRDPTKKFRIGFKEKSYRTFDGKEITKNRIIFEGYPMTPSAEISQSSGDVTLLLQHWLRDLGHSVVRSQFSYPGNIGQKYYDAITYNDSMAGVNVKAEGVAKSVGLPGDWEFTVGNDVWALGAKQILAALLTNPVMAQLAANQFCINALNQPTKAAADALQRVQGPSQLLGSEYARGGQAIQIIDGIDGRAASVLAQGVASAIGYKPVASLQSLSAWDMIVDFASTFALLIIPRPTDAFLAPGIPGLNRYYATNIRENEIRQLSWADTRNVNLRGVAIATTVNDHSGFTAQRQNKQAFERSQAGGCYVVSDDPNEGMVAFVRPPVWLVTAQIDKAPGTDTLKSGDTAGTHNPPDSASGEDVPVDVEDFFASYAKQRYIEEQLRGRTLQVVSGMRTDICPGSTIAVAIRNQYSKVRLGLETTSLVGLVREVTLSLSRVSTDCSTSFVLDFVRTIDELADDKLAVEGHPIFKTTFLGAELA